MDTVRLDVTVQADTHGASAEAVAGAAAAALGRHLPYGSPRATAVPVEAAAARLRAEARRIFEQAWETLACDDHAASAIAQEGFALGMEHVL